MTNPPTRIRRAFNTVVTPGEPLAFDPALLSASLRIVVLATDSVGQFDFRMHLQVRVQPRLRPVRAPS